MWCSHFKHIACVDRWRDIWVPAKLAAHCTFCLARIDQTPDNVPSSRLWPSLICLIDGPGWSSPGNRWHHRGSVVCAALQLICCFMAVWNNMRSYMMGGKTAGRDATKADNGNCWRKKIDSSRPRAQGELFPTWQRVPVSQMMDDRVLSSRWAQPVPQSKVDSTFVKVACHLSLLSFFI